MRIHSSTRFAALAALTGALACAGNKARTEETTPQAAAARDTTTVGRDTTGRDTTQNPPGYRGMERDTSIAPSQQPSASDTFLQKQGQGTPQDTAGYSGIERVDTTGQHPANPSAAPTDTTGGAGVGRDTSGMSGMDSTRMRSDSNGTSYNPTSSSDTSRTGATGLDSTGMSRSGDTTGYQPSQQPQDTATSR
jgi:hypothetical protein